MHDTDDEKKEADIKVDVGLKTEIKADLAPMISATPTGLKYIFNLLFGKKHAAAERMIKLADAQNTIDIKKIMSGDAIYDQESNQLLEVRPLNPKIFIAEKIQDDEVTNLIECSMHAATHINQNESPEFIGATEEFLSRWKSEAKHFSTEEARAIWGKVLAQEVNSPGSISLRTIDIIKNLSKDEATYFNDACKYVVYENYLVDNKQDNPIPPQAFFAMRDAGLIANYTPGNYKQYTWLDSKVELANGEMAEAFWIRAHDILLFIEKTDLKSSKLPDPKFLAWELTIAGRELYKVVSTTMQTKIEDVLRGLPEIEAEFMQSLKYTRYTDVKNMKIDSQSITGVIDASPQS